MLQVVRYDDLMQTNAAPAVWLKGLTARHGTSLALKPQRPGQKLTGGFNLMQTTYKNEKRAFDLKEHSQSQMYRRRCVKAPFDLDDFAFTNEALDWGAEALAGFTKLPASSPLCGKKRAKRTRGRRRR